MAKNYLIIIILVLGLLHQTVKLVRVTDDGDYDFYKDTSSLDSNINHISETTEASHPSSLADQDAGSAENGKEES